MCHRVRAGLGRSGLVEVGVFEDAVGLFVLAEGVQVLGEGVGRGEGVGMVVAESAAVEVVGVFEQRPGGPWFASGLQVAGGVVEQPSDLEGDVVEVAAGIGRGQQVGEQLSSHGPAVGVVRLGGHGGA